MHTKIVLLCLIFSGYGAEGFAEGEDRKAATTSIYLELGGAAGIWSLNYDRALWEINENFRLHGRAGMGLLSEFKGAGFLDVLVPISANMLFGQNQHRVEAGGGLTYYNWAMRDVLSSTGFSRRSEFLGHLTLGYRFQKVEGGIMFRVTYTPIMVNYSNKPFEHWAGVSIGKTLKGKGTSMPGN